MYRSRRRRSLPILTVTGTYYDIGYDVGRTFATIIQKVINGHVALNKIYIQCCETIKGKNIYDCCLQSVQKCYPNYIRELQGMAEGAKVPFFKLFLFHLDDVLPNVLKQHIIHIYNSGCTSLILNHKEEKILGHTIDAHKIFLNNLYIVKGHVTECYPHEIFTALCYPGLLPGSIMGYNSYGLLYTVNYIHAKHLNQSGIPRTIIARALLVADSVLSVKSALRCSGHGLADAISVNFVFLQKKGFDIFYNVEASPAYPPTKESEINLITMSQQYYLHCNNFQRLSIPENEILLISSKARADTLHSMFVPRNKQDIINALGDLSHDSYKIFTDFDERVITIAVINICGRMAPCEDHLRRQSIPIIHVKGSYFEVGYDVGRTFGSLIHSHLKKNGKVDETIGKYETVEGKQIYDHMLANVIKHYPQYVEELKGIAEGANVPFHKLFLLHLGDILTNPTGEGCTTLCINEKDQQLMGHTEDGFEQMLNHLYIVKAHITENEPHEVFTALCYAGLLPGYSMGFNMHGLVFTVNIIHAKHLNKNGIPRTFVARALLTADSFQNLETILQCKGNGIADAMSVNFSFLNQQGDRLFHNIEVGPTYPFNFESSMSILTVSPGEKLFHCNQLLHLLLPEDRTYHDSSITRLKTRNSFGELRNKNDLIKVLGDTSHPTHNIFRDGNIEILTLAVGIFDLLKRTWSIYLDNPKTSDPSVIIPLQFSTSFQDI